MKRLFPPPRQGDKLRVRGVPTATTRPPRWPWDESYSALCCSCRCSRASAGAPGLGVLWWRRKSSEGPRGRSWVRTPGPRVAPQLLPAQTPLAVSCPLPPAGARLRRALASPCQLWSLPLPVAELGLGYASEETVIFRYCAGSCPRGARTQHGLTLARLRGQGRAHGGPCCRPTRYADVAFLDDRHRWQRLPQLSAAACSCGA
nr:persephin [Mirounga angustirostris]